MIYFITGGSRGIGRNLVEEAVRAGHDVAFTYVNNADMANELVARARGLRDGARVAAYQMDVRNRKQVDAVVDEVADAFETIDVAVCNAGITRDSLVMNMTDEEWDDVIATNLTGPFYTARAVIPVMLAGKFGRIITVSSVVANGATGQANYCASKAGLHGLTQALAKEYGRKKITSNVVVPGFFDTDMTREGMPEAVREFWRRFAPVEQGRVGELHELSRVILFLGSRDSSFINGQIINVTAGLDWTP